MIQCLSLGDCLKKLLVIRLELRDCKLLGLRLGSMTAWQERREACACCFGDAVLGYSLYEDSRWMADRKTRPW